MVWSQYISSVVGNLEVEAVGASNRSQLYSKEIEFPSHSTVKKSFCSRVLVSHDIRTSYLLSEGGEQTKAIVCCMFLKSYRSESSQ